ncbi:MAG: CDP-alcohol phosphatidyltransferase family protein [Anaerolineae bacterium]
MANLITVARFPVLIITVFLLYAQSPLARLLSVPLLGILILLDSVDGLVARARNEVSLLGSVLDIMTDRAVELVMWVALSDLGLIPVAIPLIVILRGTIVDSLRSMSVSAGTAPFKAMRTGIGRWLVGSPVMRTGYAIAKLVSFAGLALVWALAGYAETGAVAQSTVDGLWTVFRVTSWVAVVFCLARGVPVVTEALSGGLHRAS